MRIELSREKIDRAVANTFQLIRSYYRVREGKKGWHQFLGSDKIGTVASAQALLCFNYFKQDFSEKNEVVEMLKEAQFSSDFDERSCGGWAYVTNASQHPTAEPTCWVTLSLMGGHHSSDNVQKGIGWLLANRPADDSMDLGWGSTGREEPRVYTTVLVLRILAKSNNTSPEFHRAKNWLVASRNDIDGGWGEKRGTSSTFIHTAHALIALIECGVSPDIEIIDRGCKWLLQMFDEQQMWNDPAQGGLVEHFDINNRQDQNMPQRVTFFHFTTPWVVTALMACGKINSIEVAQGIRWIVKNCDGGYWSHPFLPKRKVMWAIHDSLLALHEFQERFTNWNEISKIIYKDGEIIIKPYSREKSVLGKFFFKFIRSKITWVSSIMIVTALSLMFLGVISKNVAMTVIIVPFLISLTANLLTRNS